MGFLAGIKFGIGCLCGIVIVIVVSVLVLLFFLRILTWPWGG